MPDLSTDDLTKTIKDVLYVGVGLGVIAFQRAQVQRVDLTKQIKAQFGEARDQVEKMGGGSDDLRAEARRQVERLADGFDDRVQLVEERLDTIESQFDGLLDQIEEKLPEQARELVKQARDTAKEARSQVRALVHRNGIAA